MKRTLLIVILLLLPGSVYPSTKFIRAQRPIENSYIVVLRHDAPALAAAAEHLAVNAKGVLRTTYGGLAKAFWVEMSEVEALRMSEHPWVDWVEEDAVVELAATQTNLGPLSLSPPHRHGGTYSSLWHLDRIDQATPSAARFDGNYHYCSTGSGVRVYVVDTGVLPSHKEFRTGGVSRVDSASSLTTFLSGQGRDHRRRSIDPMRWGVAGEYFNSDQDS